MQRWAGSWYANHKMSQYHTCPPTQATQHPMKLKTWQMTTRQNGKKICGQADHVSLSIIFHGAFRRPAIVRLSACQNLGWSLVLLVSR
ncbi:uncharacterized protein CTRU02_213537 [Colletotrichum truncatum]|uniref:Uncharacterized protein n=1 Tax=Colletotrichum truncatum TaxID=5467 RepID=A0ACC3YG09_COLTU|nr:uncharacterized protein CTRU02_12497 [Colletotrichum truncatum]KAF6784508.1 hypothetical protein CTRU02_12497 [Colletotrichum truncatum]